MKKCPYCAEEIQDEAIVCRWCGRELVENVDEIANLKSSNEDKKEQIKELKINHDYLSSLTESWLASYEHSLKLDALPIGNFSKPIRITIDEIMTIHKKKKLLSKKEMELLNYKFTGQLGILCFVSIFLGVEKYIGTFKDEQIILFQQVLNWPFIMLLMENVSSLHYARKLSEKRFVRIRSRVSSETVEMTLRLLLYGEKIGRSCRPKNSSSQESEFYIALNKLNNDIEKFDLPFEEYLRSRYKST